MQYDLLTILGPTATGKTKIASMLATEINGEIISADSRQVYKGMNIGTGKDLKEFNERNINYYLIDIAEPSEEYNLFRFKHDFNTAYNKIKSEGRLPVMVGGTGLYISSIVQNYSLPEIAASEKERRKLEELSEEELRNILLELKPDQHNITDISDKERIITAILVERSVSKKDERNVLINSLNIGIRFEREEIKKRITDRLKQRLDEGMIEEVGELIKKGITFDKLIFFGLEYKYAGLYITGKMNYNDMLQKLNSAIHSFAKRQMTWFRKMERESVIINWFNGDDYSHILEFVKSEL